MRQFKDTRGKSWFDVFPIKEQIDITHNYKGTIRAFHRHQKKEEWMFVILGEFKFVLTNPLEIIYASQGETIKIGPNRWHGYQALTEGIVMEYGTEKHDLENPDDEREVWDKFNNWEKEKK